VLRQDLPLTKGLMPALLILAGRLIEVVEPPTAHLGAARLSTSAIERVMAILDLTM
jgi:hypothetical protein